MLLRTLLSALSRTLAAVALAAPLALPVAAPARAQAPAPETITLDFSTYNPLSLLIRDKGWAEEAFAADGIEVRWVQTLGSNKAIEFLNADSIDFGATAGAAALLGRLNGGTFRTIYTYSRPEWTALVTRPDTGIATVADLKGRTVAVTRGTDPYIFLLLALDGAGLGESDIEPVLLQHADGGRALVSGQVDAWAGLDPMMAQAEITDGAILFHRAPEKNTWGTLNVRAAFAEQHPQLVTRVLELYERARAHARDNPQDLADVLAQVARLEPAVAQRQLERTDLSIARIGPEQAATLNEAGLALQKAGIIAADVDVAAEVDALLDESFTANLAN